MGAPEVGFEVRVYSEPDQFRAGGAAVIAARREPAECGGAMLFLLGSGISFCRKGTNMGQHSIISSSRDGALETWHIVFSVGDDLSKFSVRSALDLRGAQIGHLQALPNCGAAAVWPVAGLALGFIDSCASCIVRTGGIPSKHRNDKKTRTQSQRYGLWQFPGQSFHKPPKSRHSIVSCPPNQRRKSRRGVPPVMYGHYSTGRRPSSIQARVCTLAGRRIEILFLGWSLVKSF